MVTFKPSYTELYYNEPSYKEVPMYQYFMVEKSAFNTWTYDCKVHVRMF